MVAEEMVSNAGLQVLLYPTGVPGQITIKVANVGPEELSPGEALVTLQQATAVIESTVTSLPVQFRTHQSEERPERRVREQLLADIDSSSDTQLAVALTSAVLGALSRYGAMDTYRISFMTGLDVLLVERALSTLLQSAEVHFDSETRVWSPTPKVNSR